MAPTTDNSSFLTRHRWLVVTVALIAAVIFLASFISRDDSVPVRSATAQRSIIRSVVSTNGKVEPLQNFEAHAPMGTTVKKVLVKEGDLVKRGQVVALMGTTGKSTGVHCHYEVWRNNVRRDPLPYLREDAILTGKNSRSPIN